MLMPPPCGLRNLGRSQVRTVGAVKEYLLELAQMLVLTASDALSLNSKTQSAGRGVSKCVYRHPLRPIVQWRESRLVIRTPTSSSPCQRWKGFLYDTSKRKQFGEHCPMAIILRPTVRPKEEHPGLACAGQCFNHTMSKTSPEIVG